MKMLVLGSAGVFTVLMISAFVYLTTPERDSIFPQVVSCVNEKPDPPTSDRNWQPTLRVKVEPVRDPGRVREIGYSGAASTTTTFTSDDPRRGLSTEVPGRENLGSSFAGCCISPVL